MKKKVLVFGNSTFSGDDLGIKIIPKLEKKFKDYEFLEADPTESLENYGKELIIIDAVMGIKDVRVIELNTEEDYEKLMLNKIYSMHDFDLGYNLKLLKRLKLIEKVKLICLPMNISEEKVFHQIQEKLL